jgi:hypothetical protein
VGGQEDGHEDGQEEYTIDYISDAALARGKRIYHVYWKPHGTQEADEADDTLEPASNLPGIDLKQFDGCFDHMYYPTKGQLESLATEEAKVEMLWVTLCDTLHDDASRVVAWLRASSLVPRLVEAESARARARPGG